MNDRRAMDYYPERWREHAAKAYARGLTERLGTRTADEADLLTKEETVRENYPKTISRLPAVVAGARVLAWAEVQRLPGNYPGGLVLARTKREYVTWAVYTTNGGETWHAFSGHYIADRKEAWDDF